MRRIKQRDDQPVGQRPDRLVHSDTTRRITTVADIECLQTGAQPSRRAQILGLSPLIGHQMLQSAVLRKTKKGADEIETRQHRLPGRLRNALIMVDGDRTVASYLEQAGELAVQTEQYLRDLIVAGFIEEVKGTSDEAAAAESGREPVIAQPAASALTGVSPTDQTPSSLATLDEARERINTYLGETMGMRAVFLRSQLAAVDSRSALLEFIDASAQAYATIAGPEAAQQWREQARKLLQGPSQ
jgi:hypothetical protein